MRNAIAATLAVLAVLALANMLGVAAAEAPTTATSTPVRTIAVEGVATVPIAQDANRATATAVYREGMAAALADGQSKAEFLASKAGVTLSSVQDIAEGGGSIECTGAGEETGYVEYQGEQPDFGSPTRLVVAPLAAARSAPTVGKSVTKHHKKKRKHPTAKKASTSGCTLSTQVSLAYAIA